MRISFSFAPRLSFSPLFKDNLTNSTTFPAMKVTLTIETGNAAFTDDPGAEVARILRDAAKHIERDGPHFRRLMDSNGNKVGEMDFTD